MRGTQNAQPQSGKDECGYDRNYGHAYLAQHLHPKVDKQSLYHRKRFENEYEREHELENMQKVVVHLTQEELDHAAAFIKFAVTHAPLDCADRGRDEDAKENAHKDEQQHFTPIGDERYPLHRVPKVAFKLGKRQERIKFQRRIVRKRHKYRGEERSKRQIEKVVFDKPRC